MLLSLDFKCETNRIDWQQLISSDDNSFDQLSCWNFFQEGVMFDSEEFDVFDGTTFV